MSSQIASLAEMSVEHWSALPDGASGELVDGRLEEEEMPDAVHETVVLHLAIVMRAWLAGQGFVFTSGVKYALTPSKGRMPDLSVFLPGSAVPPGRGPVRQPPDVAVEVLSGTPEDRRRDRVEKLGDYARFGIRFYWLIDPAARTLEILELSPRAQYTHVLEATAGKLSAIPGCAGLVVDLDALWAEIDRLG